jgi:hypothetical protein
VKYALIKDLQKVDIFILIQQHTPGLMSFDGDLAGPAIAL